MTRDSVHDGRTRDPQPLTPQSGAGHTIAISLAILLIIGGLLFFAHTQTQALFKDASDLELLNVQSPRNDGAILMGALITATGFGLLFAIASPLRTSDRWLPAGIVTGSLTMIMVAHFSIFINGITFPDQRALAVQSAFLFHDTAATAPIATFALAVATFLVLAIAGLALLALLAPRALNDHLIAPKTLTAQRARILAITLLLLAIGGRFSREFIAFAISAETKPLGDLFGMNFLAVVYILMGTLLALALLLLLWRTSLAVWGKMTDRVTRRFKLKHHRLLRIETITWSILGLLTITTLLGEPLHAPPPGADPVFAISSQGVSWAFLIVIGLYLLHRRLTSAYHGFLRTLPRPLPRIKPDHLMTFAVLAATFWAGIGLLSLLTELSPLARLTLRLIPIALLIPFFTLRFHLVDMGIPRWASESSPVLVFLWASLSILTGIMLWGIGNSVTVIFSQGSGGFLTPERQLLQPFATGIRILGSLFIVLPMIFALWRLTGSKTRPGFTAPLSAKNPMLTYTPERRPTSFPLLMLIALTLIFTMNILLTIDPGSRFDPELGHTDVLVGFWALHVPTDSDVVVMLGLAAISAAIGIVSAMILLNQGLDRNAPPIPGSGWWDNVRPHIVRKIPKRKTPTRTRT